MHVMVNMHVTLNACCTGVENGSACTMHVVRVLSNMHVCSTCNMHVGSTCNMHVTCMLYECWSNKHVGSACNMHVV